MMSRSVVRGHELLSLCIVWLGLEATPAAAQDPDQVCDGDEPALTTVGEEPVLEVTDTGTLAWLDASRGTLDENGVTRVRVRTGGGNAIVRAELVLPSSADRGLSLGCGIVADGAVIELTHPNAAESGSRLLRLSVFRELTNDEARRLEDRTRARATALRTAALEEWYVPAYVHGIVASPHDDDPFPGWLEHAIEDRCDSSEPYAGPICAALRALHDAPDPAAAVAAVRAPPPPPDLDAACHDIARLNSLSDGTSTRLAATHEVPWTSDRVAVVAYGDPRAELRPARDASLGGVIVGDVPVGADVSFRRRDGARTSGSLAVALQRFFRLAGRAFGSALNVSPDPCTGYPATRVDDEIPPAAFVGTRAYLIRDFDRERELDIDVCEGASCTDATVRTTLHVTPRRSVEFAVMLEGGFNVLSGRVSGAAAPDWAYEQPRYRAVGGTFGPEQLYVLENELRVGRLVTMSALLGVSFPLGDVRAMAAIGVVLFDGEGRRSFTEGSLRFGIEVAPYVYLTIGSSLTRLPLDVDPGQPQAVAVPRPTAGTVPPGPTLDPADAWVWNGGLGLAIDLALFGSAAEDVVKALGGGS